MKKRNCDLPPKPQKFGPEWPISSQNAKNVKVQVQSLSESTKHKTEFQDAKGWRHNKLNKGEGCHFENCIYCYISATDYPISMKLSEQMESLIPRMVRWKKKLQIQNGR